MLSPRSRDEMIACSFSFSLFGKKKIEYLSQVFSSFVCQIQTLSSIILFLLLLWRFMMAVGTTFPFFLSFFIVSFRFAFFLVCTPFYSAGAHAQEEPVCWIMDGASWWTVFCTCHVLGMARPLSRTCTHPQALIARSAAHCHQWMVLLWTTWWMR